LELAAPIPALAATTSKLEFANFGLVYGQTVLASVMFNNLSKTLPKPFQLNGNSLLAFAAAYSASASLDRQQPGLTRPRREVEMVARDVFWAFELGLASVTGASDVASGRGDVYSYFAGAVLGTGLGIGIQAAHQENVLRGPSPNWAYPLIGFALASGFGVVLPACLRSDATVALNRAVVAHRIQLVPFSDATGASGLALSGLF
jgi:hypothetical protein